MALYTTALIKVLQTINQYGTSKKSLCMLGRQSIVIEWESFMKIVDAMNSSYDRKIYNSIKNTHPIVLCQR